MEITLTNYTDNAAEVIDIGRIYKCYEVEDIHNDFSCTTLIMKYGKFIQVKENLGDIFEKIKNTSL